MTISENPTASEIAACLRRSALIWASEYHDDETAEWYADWYSVAQPPMDHNKAFAKFEAWRGEVAAKLYGDES